MINRMCQAILEYCEERMAVVIVGIFAFVIFSIGFLIYAAIADSQSPVLTLKKSEWECTGTRSEPTTIYIQSGKTMVPMTTYHDVCVEYKRR